MDFNKILKSYLSSANTDMKTVYLDHDFDKNHLIIYPYFFISEREEDFTKDSAWIGSFAGGVPSTIEYYIDGEHTSEYHQYGDYQDKYPLIYLRDFHSIKKAYIDIIDEFILYFNLYKDKNSYIFIDDDGSEYTAITIDGTKEIKIKTNLLMKFMVLKNYSLALNFDLLEYDYKDEFKLDFENIHSDYIQDKNEYGMSQSSMGKKIIRKPLKKKEKEKVVEYENFIINVDEWGDSMEFNSNHTNLSNNFQVNKGNPHYLTPVFFKKEVLSKYYSQTEKYTISDIGLQCASLWLLRLDMNNPKYIIAYLGDLGKNLPMSEQKYWKNFNVAPNGTISEVEYKRSFLAQFVGPTDSVLIFKELLSKTNKYWFEKFGFFLFKPLNDSDTHHLKSFRIPLTNEQKDFDEQLHSLSKMLLDSINVKEINKFFKLHTIKIEDKTRDISRLMIYLKNIGKDKEETDDKIGYFKMLYDLRSKMTAHRKSDKTFTKELEKHKLLDKENIEKIKIIVNKINDILNWLTTEKVNKQNH